MKTKIGFILSFLLLPILAAAQVVNPGGGGGGAPTGPCGGDLGGTYPNCTVVGAHIVSGNADGLIIGATTPAAGTFSLLNVTNSGANSGTLTNGAGGNVGWNFRENGPDPVDVLYWGANASTGLSGTYSMGGYDETTTTVRASVNQAGDVCFDVPLSGGNVGTCAGAPFIFRQATGNLGVTSVTTLGTTAGFMDFPQGTTSAAVAPCNTATSICMQAPTSVTSYLVNLPGAAASGLMTWTNVSNVVTESVTVPAAGILTFLATPSSANLASALTDETGSGPTVFATSAVINPTSIGATTPGTVAATNLSNTLMQNASVATVASAGTIAPVTPLVIISGTAAIATITLPSGFTTGCFDIDATGAWTTTTAGNIQAVMTASAGIGYRACYYGTKWLIK